MAEKWDQAHFGVLRTKAEALRFVKRYQGDGRTYKIVGRPRGTYIVYVKVD